MPSLFPFTAIVHQERLKRALILNAVYPAIGGVLIRGERGTAKSTAARALGQLLPDIEVVTDCPFSCDPDNPASLCSGCQERLVHGESLPRGQRRVRLVELPVSATEDRVVGSLDIQRAIQTGERHFEPGVLAAANRGILYIDEVNLLDDHVVDLLLDASAMGVNVVEREGISFSHPARFILVGTMNPEEGDLRPQLLDRFALVVTIQSVTEPAARAQVLQRRLAYETDPATFYREWAAEERRLAERIVQAQRRVGQVEYSERDLLIITDLTSRLRVLGHRADLAILKTALAQAAFDGRPHITQTDVALAVELALPHRMRQDPFPDGQLHQKDLQTLLADVYKAHAAAQPGVATGPGAPRTIPSSNKGDGNSVDASDDGLAQPEEASSVQPPGPAPPVTGDRLVASGAMFRPRRLTTSLDSVTRRVAGRRSLSRTHLKRGHYISSRAAPDAATDLALDATLRAAAPYQRERRGLALNPSPSPSPNKGGTPDPAASSPPSFAGKGAGELGHPALFLHPSDLRRKIRTRRVGNLILFAVDASWSMAAAERMAATKGAVMSLLQDAYERRDRVGLLVFRRDSAHLVLPFTNSVARARRLLADIPLGGKTPLAQGLWLAWQTFQTARRSQPHALPILILLTDGVGNVAMTTTLTPETEIAWLAQHIRQASIRSVVIDSEGAGPASPAAKLATALGGQLFTVSQLRADTIIQAIKL